MAHGQAAVSHFNINCQCGFTADYRRFLNYRGQQLVANQWHCPKCEVVWQLNPGKIEILRQPGHTQRELSRLVAPTVDTESAVSSMVPPSIPEVRQETIRDGATP